MDYLIFKSSTDLFDFFKRKLNTSVKDKLEYCIMEKFSKNRLLFTAEHSIVKKLEFKERGVYTIVGDKNTDLLAKLGAYYLRSAYILPLFLRTEADASRDPKDLGKGLRLFVKLRGVKKETLTYIPIHTNPSYLPYLENYNERIEKLNPKLLISVHGMGSRREFDVLLGFGENYESIGGKKEAFNFKHSFIEYLDGVFRELGLKNDLKIAVSTWLFTGSKNYILTKHVIEHNRNKNIEEKRYGLQAEFNLKGRVDENMEVPNQKYQVLVQALGDFFLRWISRDK